MWLGVALNNSTPDTLDAVRAAVAVLIEHGPVETLPVASGLLAWLDAPDSGVTLDAALNLRWGWRQSERLRRRDVVVRDVARRRFAGLSLRATARAVCGALRGYEANGWLRDRTGNRPDGTHGDLWDVLNLGAAPGEEMLRTILRGG
jgi:hypothetical protein